MLRSTRALWSRSTRAVGARNASLVATRQPPHQITQFLAVSRPRTARVTVLSQIAPLIHATDYTTKPPGKSQYTSDPDEEKKFGGQKLESHPEAVTSESSVRHLIEPAPNKKQEDVTDGIVHDLLLNIDFSKNLVKETFALNTVPKESYILGLAGTVPYVVTSMSTVYLSWALNTEWPTASAFKNSFLMTHESAQYWLSVIEPVQLGYGAVIISFLGAIHWGLEYAEKKPSYPRTQFRYGLGLLASIVAWPTLLMPWQFALTTQFAAFAGLYFADSRASLRGWAPYWYSSYRFVLTAIVGGAIMISLIGRAKIGDTAPRLSGLSEKFHQKVQGEEPYSSKWEKAEGEERVRQKKAAEEAEKKKKKEEADKKKKEAADKKKGEKEGKGAKENKENKENKEAKESKESQDGEENKDEKESESDKGKENEDGTDDDKGDDASEDDAQEGDQESSEEKDEKTSDKKSEKKDKKE